MLRRGDSGKPGRILPGLQSEAAYDANRALNSILAEFLKSATTPAGWLAVRRGDQLILTATKNATRLQGTAFDIQTNALLQHMREGRTTVLARRGRSEWAATPHAIDPICAYWAAFPLVIGDRFIGAISTWGRKTPSTKRVSAMAAHALQVSQNVDLVITLGELTNQLRRLATLNEFALAISSAEELPQIAARILNHLSAIFPEQRAVLVVPSVDGQLVHEFRSTDGAVHEQVVEGRAHPLTALLFPSEAAGTESQKLAQKPPANTITLPLRYRESVVGAMMLEDAAEGKLSRYDYSMLAVVATYLAGVVEHGRLRSEALERAQRLEQTVEQLREAELTASARLGAQQAAESRLLQAAKLVAVGEMAAGVAHELNNPLTTVTGFAELILDETPAEAPYRADLEMVLHEAHRARSVVRRLLDFARQGERVRARADINEIVEDVLALMTHFIHTSGVQLEVYLGERLPWISLDGNQIKQVLLNLLHNALHAMPAGGRLDIRTEAQKKDSRDWIVVHVTDNGTGMEPYELERIFEPFYTTRAEDGGTGLGLSVTYGIVSEHGGTIEVRSRRGGGSTFSVWLPA
jgi:signal transduction histidine kinase